MIKVKALLRLLVLVFIVAILFLSYISQFATPDMGSIYSVKRLKEKIVMQITPNPQSKADYYNYLVQMRLGEIEEMFETGNIKEKEMYGISLRYSTTVGDYMDFLLANNMTEKLKKLYLDIPEHQKALQRILDTYPDPTGLEKKWMQDAINYLEIYKTQIKDSGRI
jgi:hypothetical protein